MSFLTVLITFLALCGQYITLAERVQPHLHPEVKIVGYEGPLTKKMLTLFRGAEILEMIDCNLTSVPEKVFSMMPKIKKVFLKNTISHEVHSDVGEGVPSIEEFYYIRGYWPAVDLKYWNGYSNLKIINIEEHRNPLVELKANSLNETTKLEHLEITWSGVEKIDDLAFNNLDKLETLILTGNKLKTISKETLAPLKSLRKLDLHRNQLESLSISQIPELPELESIDLSNNPLKSLSLSGIEKLAPKLKRLELSRSEIPDAELENLAKSSGIQIITHDVL